MIWTKPQCHYDDVIMSTIASQITSLTIVYSTVYSDADQRKHQSSASLAFVWGIHRGPVNSPHKWPVTRKMFPFEDVIMVTPRRNTTKLESHSFLFGCNVFTMREMLYSVDMKLPIHVVYAALYPCQLSRVCVNRISYCILSLGYGNC